MRTHGAHPHRRAGRVGLLGHRGDAHPGPAPQSGAAGGGERPLAGRDGREARGCPRPGRPAAVRAPGAGRRAGPRMCRRAPLHPGRRLAPTGPSAAGGGREGGRSLRRVPPRRPRRVPRRLRLGPPAARPASRVRLWTAGVGRAGSDRTGAAGGEPGLLPHRGGPRAGPAAPRRRAGAGGGDRRRRLGHHRRRAQGDRGDELHRGDGRLPRVPGTAPPAHARDRAGAFPGGGPRRPPHLHRPPAAPAAGNPGHLLRPTGGGEDGAGRRRGPVAYVCKSAVPRPGGGPGRGLAQGRGRHQPVPDRSRRRRRPDRRHQRHRQPGEGRRRASGAEPQPRPRLAGNQRARHLEGVQPVKVPNGFQFAGLQAGIKPNRKDLALVYSQAPCSAAGCFTRNTARAAPVLDAEARLPASGMRAVVVNSGNANALTGPEGLRDVKAVCEAVARALDVPAGAVLSASTGVIGHRLPAAKIVAAAPLLAEALRPEPERAAEAILTTDTRIKMAARTLRIDGKDVTISAICKGSGMIAPSLATMIAVVTTDAAVGPSALAGALRRAMERSFNALTVDNDMSTNDAVFALANGLAGNQPLVDPGPELDRFAAALTEVCKELAKDIAADGEGATKLLEVEVSGAPSDGIAMELAKSVSGSSLVKAAIFGADPNWGRVLASIGARAGTAGYDVDPAGARVSVQGIEVYDRAPTGHDGAVLKARMREPEVRVEVDLRRGEGSAVAWGCDLSYDYVKINADYTSLIVPRPDGGVGKDDRLANYSPAFKQQLLVEALGYIRRFAGTRCVVKYGGAAMVKESLKKSFCDDIGLLRSVGLRPIVVHGGGPEITRTLEKLGGKAEFVDGQRVTNASDLKVVEMVLTGSINTEIVTLLNAQGIAHAVGLSGKDGGLIRARKLVSEGRDLGQVGEVTRVNKDFLEMLLQQGYVPIISPVGLGEDGQSYNINADTVAAEMAIAIGAQKLIYLSDVPGILKAGELIGQLTSADLKALIADGTIAGGMISKTRSILKVLASGVPSVHLIDGRVPHSIIGELFTDKGVGSWISA